MNQKLSGLPQHELILGAPGTGKTEGIIERAHRFLSEGADPASLLILTPTRQSATRIREELTARAQTTMSSAPIRAWQAYAFDVLRRAHALGILPGLEFSPKLISGPEQDVMIAELLAGHSRGEGLAVFWPVDLHEALGTRGFRHEIRDFFDRMAEYNLTAEHVKELAQHWHHPEWAAAAQLYTEYQQIRRLRMPNAFDPAALIHQATETFLKNPEFLAAERAQLQLVLVDDMQEATPSIFRLLRVLADSESSAEPAPAFSVAVCTDTVVQGFRGARPTLASQLEDILNHPHRDMLDVSYRMPPDIARSWESVATRIPVVAQARHNRDLTEPSGDTQEQALWNLGDDGTLLDPEKSQDNRPIVQGLTVETAQHESRLIAQMLLEDHLYRGKAFSRSAVIVRNGSDVSRIKRVLVGQGIPVQTSSALTPVRDEPAVRPFLDALSLILLVPSSRSSEDETEPGQEEAHTQRPAQGWGVDTALSLLTSRLGGASPMDVRRLRQRLRAEELRAGGTRSSDDLLVEALLNPSNLPAGNAGAAARRISNVLAAGTEALQQEGGTAETVLWALWEASGLAQPWREQALSQGVGADRAHRDLDAMLGLFEAAARYVDQMPGATAAQFLDYIDSQDLPMDTLAQRANSYDAVEILTPALAAGRQWDTVYIAGLQEGTWPNTTIRGSLLNTQQLTDIFDVGPQAAATVSIGDRIRDTRYDELRQFSTAVSRASERLICTAVSSVDDAPSEFLDMVAPAPEGQRTNVEVRRPMTLRALIAELRQWAEKQDDDFPRAQAATEILHRLNDPAQTAGAHLPGVHPATWWGLLPISSTGAGFGEIEPIPISPSRVAEIHRSPLDWFVSASKAEAATDLSRTLGTLVHELAEDMPDAPGHQLLEELHQRIKQLNLPDTWESAQVIERAETMVRKFAQYTADLSTLGRKLVGVEGAFSVLIPGPARDALLSGRVDRLEVDSLGRFVIIDLKTGSTQPTKADLQKHPQLASYQVALEAGAGEHMAQAFSEHHPSLPNTLEFEGLQELSGGAFLIQLGRDTKTYIEQEQPALTSASTWAVELINRAAELIAGNHVEARHTSSSNSSFGIQCKLPDICPLCNRGRQVTQN